MVKEQPAVQMFLAERGLNLFDMHELTHVDELTEACCFVRDLEPR